MDGVASLEIVRDSLVVRTGSVGVNDKQASYALVDVRNAGDIDLQVSLAGHLTAADGTERAPVRPEVLVIPGHGVRTFALVADPPAPLADATSASVNVSRSKTFTHPPSVIVEEGHVFRDGDRVVVTGRAVNRRKATARAVLIAGFYDQDRRPMERGFTVAAIEGGQSHALRFVGPPGSKSAYIYVGDVAY